MNIEIFVAKRLAGNYNKSANLSTPIVKIATWGVAIGIAIMLLSIAIVTGFQQEVHKKVSGFEANYTLTSLLQESDELPKIQLDNLLSGKLSGHPEVQFAVPFATHPGILEANESIKGVLIKTLYKGNVSPLLKKSLVEGKIPSPSSNEIVISDKIARLLALKVGEKTKLFFVNKQLKLQPRNMTVVGIYHSGIAQLDDQLIYLPFSTLQTIKKWGLEMFFRADEQPTTFSLMPLVYGGEKPYAITWFDGNQTALARTFDAKDTSLTIWAAVSDDSKLIKDTAFYTFTNGKWNATSSGGSHKYYAQGYEVFLKDNVGDQTVEVEQFLQSNTPYNLYLSNAKEDHPEIYNWLELINVNVVVILVIMTFISVINMCSALLVILLEKTQLIAILKTLGMTNKSIKKVFLSL